MTPMILLDALRHSFLKLEMIRVLIFDECHNAKGKHPYACIMKVSYLLSISNLMSVCDTRVLLFLITTIKVYL